MFLYHPLAFFVVTILLTTLIFQFAKGSFGWCSSFVVTFSALVQTGFLFPILSRIVSQQTSQTPNCCYFGIITSLLRKEDAYGILGTVSLTSVRCHQCSSYSCDSPKGKCLLKLFYLKTQLPFEQNYYSVESLVFQLPIHFPLCAINPILGFAFDLWQNCQAIKPNQTKKCLYLLKTLLLGIRGISYLINHIVLKIFYLCILLIWEQS